MKNNRVFPPLTRMKFILFLLFVSALVFYFFYDFLSSVNPNKSFIESDLLSIESSKPLDYQLHVKPILERRCVVCHGCYDAPCQLKLSSNEGLRRGANKEQINDQKRINSIAPTRLFIDAHSPSEWRGLDFTSVLNEAKDNPKDNLANSVLYRLLHLKQQYPQPRVEVLSDKFTFDLNREQSCPTAETIEQFTFKHPLWGMPYAMPNLSTQEYQTLVSWIAQGALAPPAAQPSAGVVPQLTLWHDFFNQTSKKQQLVSRYLYEHLFHAHIHFKGSPAREFYRLVRSTTPPGSVVNEIATLLPNDDPGVNRFYYRLVLYTPSIVTKNHIVYEFSETRLQRYHALFLKPNYTVRQLPSYDPGIASNPFKVFADIPAKSRYRFLLDEAHFFIEGFIKGPVCRGQVALNVIEDQFWVVFFNPEQPIITNNNEFINKMADELQLPADFNNNLDLLKIWTRYWKGQRQYMQHKQAWFKNIGSHKLNHAMNYIWDGDGKNPNAALTIFRHFDSASVVYGLVGKNPETSWVIDYPLLERIHYLLVVDYNLFGNFGHRMSTRIYMDFLRMEGEDFFLAFLPVSKRKLIRDNWYLGQRRSIEKLFLAPQEWLNTESVIDYQTDNPQQELYQHIKKRLSSVSNYTTAMNNCGASDCAESTISVLQKKADAAMKKIAKLQGKNLHAFPDVAFVRIETDNPDTDLAYSLIRNKAYKNVTSFLADEKERDRADIKRDTMTVVNWLEGSYPNFFFSVKLSNLDEFTERCSAIRNASDYEKFVEQYGVRRTNPEFWSLADWFQNKYKRSKPVLFGLFDLNRYQNR